MAKIMKPMRLRFSTKHIKKWSERYDYGQDETAVAEIGEIVRKRGYILQPELAAMCYWKSPRIRPRCASNDPAFIEEASAAALAARDERLRVGILLQLGGVGYPMASVILHFCHRDPYPIIDYRALWSLQANVPYDYTFPFWWEYVTCCRSIAEKGDVDMRTLDRALWQYSKVHQG